MRVYTLGGVAGGPEGPAHVTYLFIYLKPQPCRGQEGLLPAVLPLWPDALHICRSVEEAGLTDHYAAPAEERQVECLTPGHLDVRGWGIRRVPVTPVGFLVWGFFYPFFFFPLFSDSKVAVGLDENTVPCRVWSSKPPSYHGRL